MHNIRIYFWTTKDIYNLIDISDYDSFSYIDDNNIIDMTKSLNIERYIISIYLKNKISFSQFNNYVQYINTFCDYDTNIFYEQNDTILYNNNTLINYDEIFDIKG